METISSGINLQIYRDVNFYRKKGVQIWPSDFLFQFVWHLSQTHKGSAYF